MTTLKRLFTQDEVDTIVRDTLNQAHKACVDYHQEHGDRGAIGFAWVRIPIRTNTKLAKFLLNTNSFSKHYRGGLELWMPGRVPAQSMDIAEVGARVAAQVLKERLGIEAYDESRMD